jgi:hypothetical protein
MAMSSAAGLSSKPSAWRNPNPVPATYHIDLASSPGAVIRAFDYDAAGKSLIPRSLRCELETGFDYWAIKANGDYLAIFDEDGLVCGDFSPKLTAQHPRLEFICTEHGIKQCIAVLTQTGILYCPGVSEQDILPDGLNLFDQVVINRDGVWATKLSELWLLSDNDGNYLCCDDKLIAIHP